VIRKIWKALLMLAGFNEYDFYIKRWLRRRYWFDSFQSKVKIPKINLTFPPVAKISTEDIELCKRLISAYHKSLENFNYSKDVSPGWDVHYKHFNNQLVFDLKKKDAKALAITLSTMFRSRFLYGMSTAHFYKGLYKNRFGLRIWSVFLLEYLVSLGEYLSVVRTECPEQGIAGYAFKEGIDELVSKINNKSSGLLGFPEIGSPYGLISKGTLITMDSPEHTYVALRIKEEISKYLKGIPNIVEIGGGFGGMALRLLQLLKMNVKSYTVIDLPEINGLQGYFLSKALGVDKISLYGETNEGAVVHILPTFTINSCRNVDLLINQNSLPEMSQQVVEEYILWSKQNLTTNGIFYSYNQEAYSPVNNIPQILVPEVIASIGGFERMSRNFSWLHAGYVEEVYAIKKYQD
jgi:hypothetical protein